MLEHLAQEVAQWSGALLALPGLVQRRITRRREPQPVIVQEKPGFHLCIAPDSQATGRFAAYRFIDCYRRWLRAPPGGADAPLSARYFTVAVGGGNTVKNLYHALLAQNPPDVDWLEHVRFFFLEDTLGADNYENAHDSLCREFIEPLGRLLAREQGAPALRARLGLAPRARRTEVSAALAQLLTLPIGTGVARVEFDRGDRPAALREARAAARRYQRLLREWLGDSLRFHLIVSGVGKDGAIGAFEPYSPGLKSTEPGVITLQKRSGAISVALNRGVLVGVDDILLLLAGSHKLRALGRFEMDEVADFEQTVRETPLRMLRVDRATAEKVHIFADDRALLFEEAVFAYRAEGRRIEVKSEVRAGDEKDGIHILLVHGFMGLYSYVNMLIRLPRAWQVSALRRDGHAKTLPRDKVFPHHARSLRKIILRSWRTGRPTPVCCHSMAGLICDNLLLSLQREPGGKLPAFAQLPKEDRELVEALRAGGIVNIATWAPSDTAHLAANMKEHRLPRGRGKDVDTAPRDPYRTDTGEQLAIDDAYMARLLELPDAVGKLLNASATEKVVNGLNLLVRQLLGRVDLQRFMKQEQAPYGMRLLSSRVLQKVSFFGVLKEMDASMHDPRGTLQRHLRALDAIIAYDIPYLCIVHRHDMLVSAHRHLREHDYLLAARMRKEGVTKQRDLEVPVDLLFLGANEPEPPQEMIDPHFLIMSRSKDGEDNARHVTAAMTAFVHANVRRASAEGRVRPLASLAGDSP